jgi:RimJ/RimL family protein N-acetyltransferase
VGPIRLPGRKGQRTVADLLRGIRAARRRGPLNRHADAALTPLYNGDVEIVTSRLRIVAGDADIARAEVDGSQRFGELLRAKVPADWPPPLNDSDSMNWFLRMILERPDAQGWYALYFILRDGDVTIGNGGFKGPPDDAGVVEVGYSVLPAYQRRGFANEGVGALIEWALAHDEVTRVIAHTLPDLTPSIGVLTKLGFTFTGPGSEEGTIRYDLPRREGGREA